MSNCRRQVAVMPLLSFSVGTRQFPRGVAAWVPWRFASRLLCGGLVRTLRGAEVPKR